MRIRSGDKVKVIAGKDKGKVSKVLRVLNKENQVVVEGVNLVKKNIKRNQNNEKGGIIEMEKPIDVSNVMYYNESLGKAIRVGYKQVNGKKIRICKKTGEALDNKENKKANKTEDPKATPVKKGSDKKDLEE
ncbi:50S ribosomal protein L24 [Patescibacteria group bacterium]|nr:50S ribosomal protein L24 [Patescibacteria group bacterium]